MTVRANLKRAQILKYIHEYMDENGHAPKIREIMRALGINSTSNVKYHLDRLAVDGDIEKIGTGNWRRIIIPGTKIDVPELPEWARNTLAEYGEIEDEKIPV